MKHSGNFKTRPWYQLLQKSTPVEDDDDFNNADYHSDSSESKTNLYSSDSEADATIDDLELQELAEIEGDDRVRSEYGSSTDEENDPDTRLKYRALHKEAKNTLCKCSSLISYSADWLDR